MRQGFSSSRLSKLKPMLVGMCLLAALGGALSGQPRIEIIELFLNDRVLIHFDTEPNRTYELQYTETLTNGVPGGTWTNLFVAPNIPSVGHYIIPDTRLRPQRFYRLRATP